MDDLRDDKEETEDDDGFKAEFPGTKKGKRGSVVPADLPLDDDLLAPIDPIDDEIGDADEVSLDDEIEKELGEDEDGFDDIDEEGY